MKKETLKAGWRVGWPWGLVLFLWLEIIPMIRDREFDLFIFVAGIIWWPIGGLIFGLWYNHVVRKLQDKRTGLSEKPRRK